MVERAKEACAVMLDAPSLRGAKRRSNPYFLAARWIASRSLSSGARSHDPLACNDRETYCFGSFAFSA